MSDRMKEFEALTKPLNEWLQKNYDLHCKIIVSSDGAELTRDELGVSFKEISPELKENEDDRIGKALIQHIKDNVSVISGWKKEELIAWLEKRGEHKLEGSFINVDDVREGFVNEVYRVLDSDHNNDRANQIIDAFDSLPTLELEKQGEKKPQPKFKVGDYVKDVNFHPFRVYQIMYIDNECYICQYTGKEQLGDKSVRHITFEYPYLRLTTKPDELTHSEQKPADKVEPKFKVGDWIVQEGVGIFKIIEICESWYEVIDYTGKRYSIAFLFEKRCCLWTIKDAKDGDVLANEEMLVIFKNFEEPSYRQRIVAYIGLDTCGNIQITDDTWTLGIDKAKPATKEQRDLLFRKMKEAGYEWDAEKKELKKIEQNHAWSDEDENMFEDICSNTEFAITKRPSLSKELGEEQLRWLKSFKERCTWKPSDEQMRALKGVASYNKNDTLESLYNDLKKLKEK